MFAAYKKLTGVLAVLLDYGADVDMINKVVNISSWRGNVTLLLPACMGHLFFPHRMVGQH